MNAAEFYDAAQSFDWFYEMSDDHRVWASGKASKAALLKDAPPGSENRQIWDSWEKHHYSGEPWNTPQAPKPERPKQ